MEEIGSKKGQEMVPYKPGSRFVIERAVRSQIETTLGVAEGIKVNISKMRFRFRNGAIECFWHHKRLRLDIHPGFFRVKEDK